MKYPLLRFLKPLLPYALIGGIFAIFYLVWVMNESPLQGIGLLFMVLYLWVFFSLLVYFVWTHTLASWLKPFSTRWKVTWLLGCLLAGFWLADNIPVILPGVGFAKILFFLCSGVGLGLLLFFLSIFFVTRRSSANQPKKRRFRWLFFTLPILGAWIVYLLIFWPGMMSADSLEQWGQVLTGQYNNHHPAFHTFTIWLLTRISDTPAIIALAQIASLALVGGLILAYIESLGVPSFWVWVACLLFAVSPVNGTMVNTLWKDIPFSTAMLGFSYLILRLAQSKGKWIESKGSWFWFGITAALVALFRHNGLSVVIGAFPMLLLGFRQQWKPLVFAFTLSMVLYFGITGPLYRLAGVEETTVLEAAAASLYNLTASADPDSPAEKLLESINPLSNEWQCFPISALYQVGQGASTDHQESFLEKTQNLVQYAPNLLAYNYRCNRSLVWIIWDPNGEIRNPSHAEYWIDSNAYGITPASKIPQLQPIVTDIVVKTAYDPDINWLMWRPALYLYLFLLVIAVCAARLKNIWVLLAAVPVLIQAISFTLISMPPNFRYHYAVYLLALAFWPIVFVPVEQTAGMPPSSDSQ